MSSGTLPDGEGSFDCDDSGQSAVDGQIQIQSKNGVTQTVPTIRDAFTVAPQNTVCKQYSIGDFNKHVEFLIKVESLTVGSLSRTVTHTALVIQSIQVVTRQTPT